jgi:signal transduction histidine kinase
MEDLSLHILDIAENSIAAEARKIEIIITEETDKDLLTIEIKDDGKGMDEETVKKALDPFYTTRKTRRVGLGLSFLSQAAEESGGKMELNSIPNEGTTTRATFCLSHPDCKPMGDMNETIHTLVIGHPDINFIYEYRKDNSIFRFDSREMCRK